MLHANIIDYNGIFHAKNWLFIVKKNLLWQIIMKVKLKHIPTCAIDKSGGYDLMDVLFEERAEFKSMK